jgi:hydroxymethylbilane synthase
LGKLADGVAECTFLAMAGLNRLNMADTVPATPIATDAMLPAVAQGAIGIERRAEDDATQAVLAAIHHAPTADLLGAERAFLRALDGSCETPIAGLAQIRDGTLTLRGEILRPDGSEARQGTRSGPVKDGAAIGTALAQDLLAQAPQDFFDWSTAPARR